MVPKYSSSFTYCPVTPTLPLTESLFDPVGLNPMVPENAAGILAEPAVSDPIANAAHLVATAAASPPDEPPLMKPLL